ncbi:MAG: hypothetical protein WAW41_10435 [Methylobacter sp.]
MIRTAVINKASRIVQNIIEFESEIPTNHLDGVIWIASDSAQIGATYLDGVFTNPESTIPSTSQLADGLGFVQALKVTLGGIVQANALAVSYPLFFAAVQSGDWVGVQELIVDAKTKSLISTDQFAAIKAAALECNIPIFIEQ